MDLPWEAKTFLYNHFRFMRRYRLTTDFLGSAEVVLTNYDIFTGNTFKVLSRG